MYGPHSRHRKHFGTDDEFDLAPRVNIAPSPMLRVVTRKANGQRLFITARWGLIPSWVKDPTEFGRIISTRSATAAVNPMSRHAVRDDRFLVPADAVYEEKAVASNELS